MESPFDVLSVDADADDEEIEQAYRERVKRAHPDQGGSVEEFQTVRRAYEQIKAGYSENGAHASAGGSADVERADAGGTTAGSATTGAGTAGGTTTEAGTNGATSGSANAGGTAARSASGRDQRGDRHRSAPDPEQVSTEVTYLNYEVLGDFGWEVDDDDLLGKAARADLDETDYGQFRVQPGESLLEAAEDRGFAWPFACRGGACANCAIKVVDGELSMPASHVLSEELMDQGIRLSCNGMPITDELSVVYNVKQMPELDDLLLPPDPFENRYRGD